METKLTQLPNLDVGQYDPYTDTITIEGTHYSGVLFREGFGIHTTCGQILQIVSHKDGVVTIRRRYDLEVANA